MKALEGHSTNLAKLKRKAAFNSYSLGAFDWASKRAGKKTTGKNRGNCKHRKRMQGAEVRCRVVRGVRAKAHVLNRRFTFSAPLAELPGESDECTALNQSGCRGAGGLDEFDMVVSYKILPHDTHGHSLPVIPGEQRVNPRVRRNLRVGKASHEICRSVPREPMREIHMGTKLG